MAIARLETTVANPGRKAGKMTAKQIKFFGTKRQKAALKTKRSKTKRKSARKSSAAHRPRAKKRNPSRVHRKASAPKKRVARKRNLGGIFALTANPAGGHRKKMAHTKKRKSSSKKRHTTAGSHKRTSNPGRRHHRRSNPGNFGNPMEWLTGGAGVLAGVLGARGLPQLLLGASNTGAVGYAANAAATGIMAFLAHMVAPRNRVLSASVLAGGSAALLSRVIGDYSLLGSYSSRVGLGDYLFKFNFATPQILGNDQRSIMPAGGYAPPPMVTNVAGAGAGVSGLIGAPLY